MQFLATENLRNAKAHWDIGCYWLWIKIGWQVCIASKKRVARNLKSCLCKKLEAIEEWKLIVHNGFVLVPFSALNQGKGLIRILNPRGTIFVVIRGIKIIYFPFQKGDITNCFTLYAICWCLELSLLKSLFVYFWKLLEPFGNFWKKEGEFEFEFGVERFFHNNNKGQFINYISI